MKDDLKKLQDRGWNEMFTLLEKELPTSRNKRKAIWWWSSGIAASLLIGSFLLLNNGIVSPDNDMKLAAKLEKPKASSISGLESGNSKDIDNQSLAENNRGDKSLNEARPTQEVYNNSGAINQLSKVSTPSKSALVFNDNPNERSKNSSIISKKDNTPPSVLNNKNSLIQANTYSEEPIQNEVILSRESASLNSKVNENPNLAYGREMVSLENVNNHKIYLNQDIPSVDMMIEPINDGPQYSQGFTVGATLLAGLSNAGHYEKTIDLGYRKIIKNQFAIHAGVSAGQSNLKLAYEPISANNTPQELFSDKTNTNLYQNSSNFSTSTASKISSKYLLSAHLGIGYFLNKNLLLETNGAIRRQFENSINDQTQNSVTVGNNTPSPQTSSLAFKNYYAQSLGLHYFFTPALNLKATYLISGQPITTGFVIDKKIKSINHFAGIGVELTF